MSLFRPFKALRPPREKVKHVAAPPYDVVSRAEAKAYAQGNPGGSVLWAVVAGVSDYRGDALYRTSLYSEHATHDAEYTEIRKHDALGQCCTHAHDADQDAIDDGRSVIKAHGRPDC